MFTYIGFNDHLLSATSFLALFLGDRDVPGRNKQNVPWTSQFETLDWYQNTLHKVYLS